MPKIALIFVFVFMPMAGTSKAGHLEKFYQKSWCNQAQGQIEYVLPDLTRVDCLTSTHAIEFDFGKKWAEAIGQSLYYSAATGKRAGIVLILKKESDRRYLERINKTIVTFDLPIDTWTMTGYGNQVPRMQ